MPDYVFKDFQGDQQEALKALEAIANGEPRYSAPQFQQPPKKPYIRRDNTVGNTLIISKDTKGNIITSRDVTLIGCNIHREQAEQVGDKLVSIHECHLHQVVVTWLK